MEKDKKTYKVLNDEITRLREEKAALLVACKLAESVLIRNGTYGVQLREIQSAIEQAGESGE